MPRRTTVLKVFKWFVLLVLVAGAAAAAYVYWMWSQADEKLRQILVAKAAELAPHWDVNIHRAHFDWDRRIHIYDVRIKARGQTSDVLTLPELVVTIDREKFQRFREVEIRSVRIIDPQATLHRNVNGQWNWQALLTLPSSDRPCPEFQIEQGQLALRLDQAGQPPARIEIKNLQIGFVPSGRRQFDVRGSAQVDDVGRIHAEGRWNLEARQWTIDGRLDDVPAGDDLLRLVAGTSAELRAKLVQIDSALTRYQSAADQSLPARSQPWMTAELPPLPAGGAPGAPEALRPGLSADDSPPITPDPGRGLDARAPATIEPGAVPAFGINAKCDVDFRLSQDGPGAEPRFRVLIHLDQGQIVHDVLPFPLRDLTGKIYWDNQRLVLRDLSAKNGVTQLTLSGEFQRQPAGITPGRVAIRLTKAVLDDRLRRRLPAALARQYDQLSPAGRADLSVACEYDGAAWRYEDLLLTAQGCTATHARFPYPVVGIVGTIRQAGRSFLVDLRGRAGRSPVTVTGRIHEPGPLTEASYTVHAAQLPVDDDFLDACEPHIRKTLEALQPRGLVDVTVRLHRPPGYAQPYDLDLDARIHTGTIAVDAFPYEIGNLSGEVAYRSRERSWRFLNLKGTHGPAQISGSGSFVYVQRPGELRLQVAGEDVPIDHDLKRAVPASLQTLWKELSPAGRLTIVTNIQWTPGGPVAVSVPEATLADGELTLASFPIPLRDLSGRVSWAGNRLDVLAFSGRHEDTQLRGRGFAIVDETGWQMTFNPIEVDDLALDRRFREALPSDLRSIVEEVDPDGAPVSLAGALRFAQGAAPDSRLTAAWDLALQLSGLHMTAGTDLKHVYGRVQTQGRWNGRQAELSGTLDLESVYVLDYQFTDVRGPLTIVGDRVTLGSTAVLYSRAEPLEAAAATRQQITGKAIGGTVTLNGFARLAERPSYQMRVTLHNGRLEDYARRYVPGVTNVSGVMNGGAVLEGRGPRTEDLVGNGRLQISPAALYELPIMVQVFQSLNTLAPLNKTAFKYADLEFDVARQQFQFRRIDLVGDALSLRGQGTVDFDGRLNLNFYSMMPRTRLPIGLIPGANAVLGEVTKGWVGVKVQGRTSAPRAEAQAVPLLNDALRSFLRPLEGGSPGMAPNLILPQLPQSFLPSGRS